MRLGLGLVFLLTGCEEEEGRLGAWKSFDPPEAHAHDKEDDGVYHARGLETPYLCRQPGGGFGACPVGERPAPADLSCDAAGCHGDHTYGLDDDEPERHLLGSDGPSCWSCHAEREWRTRTGRTP